MNHTRSFTFVDISKNHAQIICCSHQQTSVWMCEWVSVCMCLCVYLCVFVCRQPDFDRLRTSDLNLNQSRSKYYNRSLALVYDNDLPIVVAVVVVVGTHTDTHTTNTTNRCRWWHLRIKSTRRCPAQLITPDFHWQLAWDLSPESEWDFYFVWTGPIIMLNMQSHSINDRRGSKHSARSVISSLRFDLMPRKLTRKLCCIIRRTFWVALYLRSPRLASFSFGSPCHLNFPYVFSLPIVQLADGACDICRCICHFLSQQTHNGPVGCHLVGAGMNGSRVAHAQCILIMCFGYALTLSGLQLPQALPLFNMLCESAKEQNIWET